MIVDVQFGGRECYIANVDSRRACDFVSLDDHDELTRDLKQNEDETSDEKL